MIPFEKRIIGIKVVGNHQVPTSPINQTTFYHLQVTLADGTAHLVHRRFSSILSLHQNISKYGNCLFHLPEQPPKYPSKIIQDPKFIEKRSSELDSYFEELLSGNDLLATNDHFLDFCKP
jgi:hypothetical protein